MAKRTTEKELNTVMLVMVENAIHKRDNIWDEDYRESQRREYQTEGCTVSFQKRFDESLSDGHAEHAIVQGTLRDLLKAHPMVRYELAYIGIALDILENDEEEFIRKAAESTRKRHTPSWDFTRMNKTAVLKMTARPTPDFEYEITVCSGPYWDIIYLCTVMNQYFKDVHTRHPNMPLTSAIDEFDTSFINLITGEYNGVNNNIMARPAAYGFISELIKLAAQSVCVSDKVFHIDFINTLYSDAYCGSRDFDDVDIDADMATYM